MTATQQSLVVAHLLNERRSTETHIEVEIMEVLQSSESYSALSHSSAIACMVVAAKNSPAAEFSQSALVSDRGNAKHAAIWLLKRGTQLFEPCLMLTYLLMSTSIRTPIEYFLRTISNQDFLTHKVA